MMNQAGVPPVSEILIRSAWYRLGYMSKTEKLYLSELHFCTSFIVPNLPYFFYEALTNLMNLMILMIRVFWKSSLLRDKEKMAAAQSQCRR